ncbi:hypothetical protein KKD62_02460, partial [Patescibacteria group bacterium]|nr:hypothetical protein [Patescibacteria group bacterium]MBU1931731.1 hypothetical protein [Patescibacteria group bacterium]
SVQSGDNHVPAYWYTRASLKLDENPPRFFFWGPLEEGATRPSSPAVWDPGDNRWELNTPLRSASSRAELNAGSTYAFLSGNNVIVNWDINFDSDYYPGPGNYPRTHNLLLWVFDDAGLEDERNLNLIEIQHPSWHPPPDGVNDFHDMGNLTVQNCVANVVGTAYNASIYSNTTIACSNRSSLTRVGGIVIACNEYGVGADCGVPDSRTSAPAPDGSYSFIGLPLADNYNFQATVGGSGFNEVNFCSSESLSTYVTLDASGATEDLVAFQGVNESWWQAEIGDVHANGAGIRSEIPAACGYGSFDYCIPYILKNSDTIPPQEGLVTYSDGTVDYGEGDGEAESEWVANSSYNGGQRGYDYFWRLARDEEFNDDWSNSPSGSLYSLSEDVSINTAWSAFDGITVVYIGGENDEDIDYDLEINENITLDTDGFVAFIVSGDVTIAEDVTEIQAVIIADGTITVEGNGSDDFQFHGTGSFVSWSGFNFYRNLGMNGLGRDNRGDPAELFTYDPNIIRLAPDVLKRATYSWIEVAP